MSAQRTSAVLAAVMVAATSIASGQPPQNQDAIPDTPGTGPFAPLKEIDPGLPDQVVYRPADLASLGDTRLGLYVFGNGGCSNDGASARLHLLNVASHGYLAIAPGGIYNGPGKTEAPPRPEGASIESYAPTRPAQLSAAIDWALAENERADSRALTTARGTPRRSSASRVAGQISDSIITARRGRQWSRKRARHGGVSNGAY